MAAVRVIRFGQVVIEANATISLKQRISSNEICMVGADSPNPPSSPMAVEIGPLQYHRDQVLDRIDLVFPVKNLLAQQIEVVISIAAISG